MPEGHTILRAANRWNSLAGKPLKLSSPQGRFSEEAAKLTGQSLSKAYAHGKHLFLEFSDASTVHIHLGLYGRHRWHADPVDKPRDTIRLRAEFQGGAVDLSGPTQCELIDSAGVQKILDRLGADPLQLETAPDSFLAKMAKSKRQLGQVLMDQSVIAGVGNVYRAEILFMRGLSPFAEAKSLSAEEWQELWKLTRELMQYGVRSPGGIKTIYPDSPRAKTLSAESFQKMQEELPKAIELGYANSSYAYRRNSLPCLACKDYIVAKQYYGRTLFYCPTCQNTETDS